MADEIYDQDPLRRGDTHPVQFAAAPDLFTLTLQRPSKAYRLAGFRSAWLMVTGPKRLRRATWKAITILANMRLCANVPGAACDPDGAGRPAEHL